MLAKFINKIMFSHVGPLIQMGRHKPLDFEDLPDLPHTFIHQTFYEPLATQGAGDFLISLIKDHKILLYKMSVMLLGCACLNLLGPFLIKELIQKIESQYLRDIPDVLPQIILAAALGISSMSASVLFQHYVYVALQSSVLTVNKINQAILNKVLILDILAKNNKPMGDLINLIGTDAETVGDATFVGVDFIHNIFMVIAVCSTLCFFLGYAGLVGILTLLILFPVTQFLIKKINLIYRESLLHRDRRVAQLGQYLNGIRILKYFNWENEVLNDIQSIRNIEVNYKKRLNIVQGWSTLLYVSTSVIVGINCFLSASYIGVQIDAGTLFASISLFGLLQGPFANMPHQIIHLTNAQVSLIRILDFLRLPSWPKQLHEPKDTSPLRAISLKNVILKLNPFDRPTLNLINLEFDRGESIAIVGPVGSGKTSLLAVILGELRPESGDYELLPPNARIGYSSQDSLILNRSILENILFGHIPPKDDAATKKILSLISDCCLDRDLEKFPSGLETEIGENGINLSGGQKQRIALARCGVHDPEFLILDDPFSAVDTETESQLVNRLIFDRWASTTRIIVTHRLQHLSRFDRVVFLNGGRILCQGQHCDLMQSNSSYRDFVNQAVYHENSHESNSSPSLSSKNVLPSKGLFSRLTRITEDEDRARGAISLSIFRKYALALIQGSKANHKIEMPWIKNLYFFLENTWNLLTLVALTMLAALSPPLQNYVLARWSNNTENSAPPGHQGDLLGVMGIYSGLGLLVLGITLATSLTWSYRSLAASKTLHNTALSSLLKTSIGFFDATPIGRILNRFSRDIDNVDSPLPSSLQKTISHVLNLIVALTILVFILNQIIMVILPALWAFYLLQKRYRSSSREIQRLMSISRSPRFSQFKELLQGLTVIRAFSRQEAFGNQFIAALLDYQKSFHSILLANRWFSIRVPMLSGVISVAALLGVIFAAKNRWIQIGSVGMLLTYALKFWEHLNWAVRDFSDSESRMTSVERLQHFVELPPEPHTIGSVRALPPQWPQSGSIEFKNVSIRYAPHSPTILRRISFKIQSGSKVGIIGRTGSGKSTIIQAIYRMVMPYHGEILIDNFPLNGIPLDKLRRSLAIIPQDPRLFRGTLRKNLDMFDKFSDHQLWNALDQSHLTGIIRSYPDQLSTIVEEDGLNFSQGQRQLICLARALLLDAPIVILDEATASVDVVTDMNIQSTILQAFKSKTIFIIAHRLDTLRFCDRILEIDGGRLKQEGPPTFV